MPIGAKPLFSQRHYRHLAKVLREAPIRHVNRIILAEYMSEEFQQDNPKFDRDHFVAVVRGEMPLASMPPRKSL